MGSLALGYFWLAIGIAFLVYKSIWTAWHIPAILNLPGAFFVFSSVMQFTGWLTADMFASASSIPGPDVPWHSWLLFFGRAVVWDVAVLTLVIQWRQPGSPRLGQ